VLYECESIGSLAIFKVRSKQSSQQSIESGEAVINHNFKNCYADRFYTKFGAVICLTKTLWLFLAVGGGCQIDSAGSKFTLSHSKKNTHPFNGPLSGLPR